MQESVLSLYERIRRTPFPSLGKRIGDFVLYDSLLAGLGGRMANGERITPGELPDLDAATASELERLRRLPARSADEAEFLRYADLLNQLRLALGAGD